MKELPSHRFLEGFYIWFNQEEKEEYYSTPLYKYSTKENSTNEYKRNFIELEKDISKLKPSKKEVVRNYPALIYAPFVETIGMLLVKLLNADFSTFEMAYNTFFYAYGYELIKEYAPYNCLKETFESEVEFIQMIKRIYEDSLDKSIEIQENYRTCVDFIYNLNGNQELLESNPNAKFIAYFIKSDIYTYSQDIEVILDTYIKKHYEYSSETLESLVKKVQNKDTNLNLTNVYTSPTLSSICFVVLQQIVTTENLLIKTCQNCGRYFIPTYRQNEIYCDLKNIDDTPTCREKGASETYKKNLENIPALLEYRRSYQQKIMVVYRNKDNKQIKKDFEKWKKEAQNKIRLFKQGKLNEDTLYKWIMENK